MPRSLTRPITGQIVWYYTAAPPSAPPLAAIVCGTIDRTHFNLWVLNADGTLLGAKPNVVYHHLTRPAASAEWCTMPRINENAAGKWPSNDAANPLGTGGVVV